MSTPTPISTIIGMPRSTGLTFRKYYPEYYDFAHSYGLDPALKPNKLDISKTARWLGYKPSYSLANLLSELAAYGDTGPPRTGA